MDVISKRPISIEAFKLFGSAHLITVFCMIVFGFIFIKYAKKHPKQSRYFLIINLITMDLLYRLWSGFYQSSNLVGMLSVHVSSASVLLAVLVLVRYNQKVFDVLFYWGLILVPQAIITPGIIRYGFPHLRFFHIFWIHFLVVYAIMYLLLVEKRRPSKVSLKRALLVTHLYTVFVFVINQVFDTNYMFIGKKSSLPSLLDYLGPWPYYIIVLDVILIVLFILLNTVYLKIERKLNEHI